MRYLIALIFAFASSFASAAPISYALDSVESRVGFTWFFGSDAVKGRMPVSDAVVVIDFERVSNSRVDVTLDLAGVEAGFPFASQALKGENMLWADRFPTLNFKSTQVSQDGTGAKILGDLTMRGVTRPVELDATIFRKQGTAAGERDELAIRMTGAVSRAAFGATGWAGEVGDEVQLDILAVIERVL